MQIWVDADACPVVVREILVRAAQRRRVHITFVANQPQRRPPAPTVRVVQVGAGFDVADRYITEHVAAGDLVITQDIPLAAEVLARDALALSPRGELHTADTIGARLALRNFMDELRSSGVQTGGPPPLAHTDRLAFANQLDRWLARLPRDPDPD